MDQYHSSLCYADRGSAILGSIPSSKQNNVKSYIAMAPGSACLSFFFSFSWLFFCLVPIFLYQYVTVGWIWRCCIILNFGTAIFWILWTFCMENCRQENGAVRTSFVSRKLFKGYEFLL